MVPLRAEHLRHHLQHHAFRQGCLIIHEQSRLWVPQASHPITVLAAQGLVAAPLCSLAVFATVAMQAAAGACQQLGGLLATGAALITHAGVVALIQLEGLIHACWNLGRRVSGIYHQPVRHDENGLPQPLHPEGDNVLFRAKVRIVYLRQRIIRRRREGAHLCDYRPEH